MIALRTLIPLLALCLPLVGAEPQSHHSKCHHHPTPTTTNPSYTTSTCITPTPVKTVDSYKKQNKYWRLHIGDSWQWQLDGEFNYTVPALVFDIDLDSGIQDGVIDRLHQMGRKVICYVNVGSLESDRSDFSSFPPSTLGNIYPGWPNERFLDIRSPCVRGAIQHRLERASQAGCDGIEPDNQETYTQPTGFNFTQLEEKEYITWIAETTHALGMSVACKNNGPLIAAYPSLVHNTFDFVIAESCYQIGQCDAYDPFIHARKPVFATEYTDTGDGGCAGFNISVAEVPKACEVLNGKNFEGLIKHCILTGEYWPCQEYRRDGRRRVEWGNSHVGGEKGKLVGSGVKRGRRVARGTDVGGF
ncbi:hypothetical protein HDV00_000863 [Rhizophlyctis rosea]|nr:hypothetical protein HDV00_000863 [Rhizophlyctis rosea]